MIFYEDLLKVNQTFFEEYLESTRHTLEQGWYILGNKVNTFEIEFASYINSKFCIGVASGLDALIISLKILGVPAESEIIVPSNTYIATILSILHNGLKPVLVEPDLSTYNIDPYLIEGKITSKTKAIIVVHLYGKSCDMEKINCIAKKYNLFIIEDCAQAHGSKYKGKLTGTFSDLGAFSFYPTKNLGAIGDAGAITTNNEEYARKIKMLRNYGSEKKYHNEFVGYNSRLDELQAGFLSIKLKRIDEINNHKRRLAELYFTYLKDDFIKPNRNNDYFDTFHIFPVRHEKRDELKEYLLKNQILTEIHYPIPPHKQNALRPFLDYKDYPISELIHSTILSLPISYGHSTDDIMKVIEVLNKF